MAIEVYDIGDVTTINAPFDVAGLPTDPTALFIFVKPPTSPVVAYEYGVGADIVRDGAGRYHLDVECTQSGTWRFRITSTGVAQASEEGFFKVRRRVVP